MRRIFADANVLIAGAGSRSGASRAVLMLAEVGLFKLVVCRQVLDESERNIRHKLPNALKVFAELMVVLNLEIVEDPEPTAWQIWQDVIETKDAPILAAAVLAQVDRLLTLNTKDFTSEVATQSGLIIQTPAQFIMELHDLVMTEL